MAKTISLVILFFGLTLFVPVMSQAGDTPPPISPDTPISTVSPIYMFCAPIQEQTACKQADGIRINRHQEIVSGQDFFRDCMWDTTSQNCLPKYADKDYSTYFISFAAALFLVALVVGSYVLKILR